MKRFFLLIFAFSVFFAIITPTVFAEEKISVEIISVEPIRANQWTISWDACSLVEKIGQDFKISTDLEWESIHIDFILYKDQCITDILGNPIISIIDAEDPKSIRITLDEPIEIKNEQQIIITDILSAKIEGKYAVFYDVCAGDRRLISPEVLVISDIDEVTAELGSVIGLNSCFTHSTEIYAKSIDSISVEFGAAFDVEKVSDDVSLFEVAEMEKTLEDQKQQIYELKQEIEILKETITQKEETIVKKDALLMEQVKVIKDLANMVKTSIYENLVKAFQF